MKQLEQAKPVGAFESDLAKYKQEQGALEKQLAQEETAHNSAVKDFQMSKAEMEKTESDLKAAATRLRASRMKADRSGGVYPEKPPQKSAAAQSTISLLAILAVVCSSLSP